MSTNSFLTKKHESEIVLNINKDTDPEVTNIETGTDIVKHERKMATKRKMATNNYPLHKVPYESIVTDTEDKTIPDSSLIGRSLKITFETLYKNLNSYDREIDVSNKKFLKRTVYKTPTDIIYITIDLNDPNLIISKIFGATGYTKTLVRTITIDKGVKISTSYKVE